MKTSLASLLLPLAVLLSTAPAVFADGEETAPADAGFKPKEYPLARYAHLDKKSPFEFDPPPPTPPETVNSFEGVSLGGYCGSGNTLTVYLIEGKEKKRVTVHGDGSPYKKYDKGGYRILSMNRGANLKSTTVLLERSGQQAEVKFDDETLTAKAGGAGGGGQQVQMVPGPNGTMVPRQVIPRPGGGAGGQPQAYVAPAPFIPGQGGNQPNQNPQPGQPVANGFSQPNFNANNAQLTQQLMNNPNIPPQQQITNFGGANSGVVIPGQTGATPQLPQVPTRRRVVLPSNTGK